MRSPTKGNAAEPPRTPESAAPTDADGAPRAALTGGELLALQLLACGYGPDQIAALRGGTALAVLSDLQCALQALGAANVRAAVCAARDRGLIL